MSIENEIRNILGKSKAPELQESVEDQTTEIVEDVEELEELTAGSPMVGKKVKINNPGHADHGKVGTVVGGAHNDEVQSHLVKFSDGRKGSFNHKSVSRISEEEVYTVDVSEDVEALINGEDLTEEFKEKAATIFEAAVVSRIKDEVSRIEENYEMKLQEEVESLKEGIAEKVDGYLNYIVEQWMKDNEVALTHGIKDEIMENFVSGIKSVFEENNIALPEEKFDVIGEMEQRMSDLESRLNETTEKNVELHNSLNEMKRHSIVIEISEGLSDTQAEKFVSLAEEIAFESEEIYRDKLDVIRRNYFSKKPSTVVESFITEETDSLQEEVEAKVVSPSMQAYLTAITKK